MSWINDNFTVGDYVTSIVSVGAVLSFSYFVLDLVLDKNTALIKNEITETKKDLQKDMALLKQEFKNQSAFVNAEVTRGLQKREDAIIRALVSSMSPDHSYVLRVSNVDFESPDFVAMEEAFDSLENGQLQVRMFGSKTAYEYRFKALASPDVSKLQRVIEVSTDPDISYQIIIE